ncbi:MAG TPA: hypothetical protein P5186_27200 [Candidatus Paceibacterota bacterium]|nr:hypothetical protein [Verrucomicrobiota bacterium]HRY51743.1 hypothetical protein [Candidatus Paceibacterota bacterium]
MFTLLFTVTIPSEDLKRQLSFLTWDIQMAINIHNFIAAINPDVYCQPMAERDGKRINIIAEVKKLLHEKGILAAAQIARVKESEFMDFEEAENENPFSLLALKNPIERHTIVYDAFGENVTAVYYWLLDALENQVENLKQVDKLVDNFVSSPGSQHFTDMTGKAMKAQDRALQFFEVARRAVQPIPGLISELKAIKRQLEAVEPVKLVGEQELRQRFLLKQNELKQQVALAKTYACWGRPYLTVANQTHNETSTCASLVSAFNTVLFELALLVQAQHSVADDIAAGILPKSIGKTKHREYSPILIVEMNFRGVPEKSRQGGFVYRGRSDLKFTSYALNTDEITVLKELIEKDELGDLWRTLFGGIDDTIDQLQKDIEELTEEIPKGEPVVAGKAETKTEDVNPFAALWSFFFPRSASSEFDPDTAHMIRPDSSVEKVLRNQAILRARQECREIYTLFKQAHGMATMPDQDAQAA